MTNESPYQPGPARPEQPQSEQPRPGFAQPAAAPAKNPLGLIAFWIGVAAVLVGVLFTVVQAGVIANFNSTLLNIVGAANALLTGGLAVAALIVGLIALFRVPGASKPFAAAGAAIGGTLLVGVLNGVLYGAILSFLRF